MGNIFFSFSFSSLSFPLQSASNYVGIGMVCAPIDEQNLNFYENEKRKKMNGDEQKNIYHKLHAKREMPILCNTPEYVYTLQTLLSAIPMQANVCII